MGRRFFQGMWGITIPMIGEEMQILTQESGRQVAVQLWLKFALAWVLVFGPLFLLKVVSAQWLRLLLGAFPILFGVSPIFTGLDVLMFYALPGIRIDEGCLWVKSAGTASYRSYAYQNVMEIRQLTITKKNKTKYRVEVAFRDGKSWCTAMRPKEGIPFLVQLTHAIEEKSHCPISPVFNVAAS